LDIDQLVILPKPRPPYFVRAAWVAAFTCWI
jgi:hypothetical protein